ncbi:MAG: CD1871A family CXXC motif-containing protein [Desulfohalobiaceae bacterium]
MASNGYTRSYALLLLFLILLVIGINAGEVEAVLEKGISICLSCIGIE